MRIPAAIAAAATLAACGPVEEASVTYHGQVRAQIEVACVSCHTAGGIGPFALDDPEVVESLGPAIVAAVEDGSMPPWSYEESCRDVEDSLALTDAQIQTFVDWRTEGFVLGDEADYVPPDVPPAADLGEPDLLLFPAVGHLPDGTSDDDYRCLVLPHEFEQDTFVQASEIQPDRADLVHHVIIFEVPASMRDDLQDLEDSEPGAGYTCFGDARLEAPMLTGWAPGPTETRLATDSASRIQAGSALVMQVHYNTISAVLDPSQPPDRSGLALWTMADGEEPDYLTSLFPVANGGIYIEPGDEASEHVDLRRMPVDATIVGTAPHMHLLGREIETTVVRADGTRDCLSRIDDWDFDWQQGYFFTEEARTPLSLQDEIELRCVYDNSAANQPVVDGAQIDPGPVQWGDGTLDEMCLDFLILRTPYAGGGDSGLCGGFQGCLAACPEGDATCPIECMGSISYECVNCALPKMFDGCMQGACGLPMLAFGNCYDARPPGVGFFDTVVDSCATEWQSFMECARPVLADGSCSDDFASCSGIAPSL